MYQNFIRSPSKNEDEYERSNLDQHVNEGRYPSKWHGHSYRSGREASARILHSSNRSFRVISVGKQLCGTTVEQRPQLSIRPTTALINALSLSSPLKLSGRVNLRASFHPLYVRPSVREPKRAKKNRKKHTMKSIPVNEYIAHSCDVAFLSIAFALLPPPSWRLVVIAGLVPRYYSSTGGCFGSRCSCGLLPCLRLAMLLLCCAFC